MSVAVAEVDERVLFESLIQIVGTVRERPARIVEPVGPDGDCWTWAWRYAQERGFRYVEGTVWLDTNEEIVRVRAHAWCEEDTPTGVVVHEVTEGYADAFRYAGVTLDCSPLGRLALLSRPWDDDVRGSLIEALFHAGYSPAAILRLAQGS